MFGQSFGDGAADPARRAGDDRDPPGQVEQTGQDFLPIGGAPLRRLHCSPRRRQRERGNRPSIFRRGVEKGGRSKSATATRRAPNAYHEAYEAGAGSNGANPPSEPRYDISLFVAVHRFARGAAPVGAGRRNVRRRAESAAFTGRASQTHGAMFNRDACPVIGSAWRQDDSRAKAAPKIKISEGGRY